LVFVELFQKRSSEGTGKKEKLKLGNRDDVLGGQKRPLSLGGVGFWFRGKHFICRVEKKDKNNNSKKS